MTSIQFSNTYSEGLNDKIFQSISVDGLLARETLNGRKMDFVPSGKTDKFANVYVTPLKPNINKPETINGAVGELLTKKDVGIIPLSIDRAMRPNDQKVRYALSNEAVLSEVVSLRAHNCVVLLLNRDQLDDRVKQSFSPAKLDFNRPKEHHGGKQISSDVVKNGKALVPSHLKALFDKYFPDMQKVEVESVEESVQIEWTEEQQRSEVQQRTVKATIPNFRSKLIEHFRTDKEKVVHVVHAVRLYAPSDSYLWLPSVIRGRKTPEVSTPSEETEALAYREEVPYERFHLYLNNNTLPKGFKNQLINRLWSIPQIGEGVLRSIREIALIILKKIGITYFVPGVPISTHTTVLKAQAKGLKYSAYNALCPTKAWESSHQKIGARRSKWEWGTLYDTRRTLNFLATKYQAS